MNSVGRFAKMLTLGVAAAAMLAAYSAEAATGKAVVRAIRGSANYSEAGGDFQTLRVGKVLGQGSTVQTSAASTVDLYLAENGPTVRVTEGTTLALDKLFKENAGSETIIETQLDLQNGTILGVVSKMAAASKYEVKTPMGVAGIRGTKYRISADGRIDVLEGTILAVYIINGNPMTFTINAGQSLIPGPDRNTPPTIVPLTPEQIREIEGQVPGPIPTPTTPPIVNVPTIPVSPTTGVTEGHSN